MKKIAIFVDIQNIYYTTKEGFGRHFDYNKFWAQATKNCQVEKAIAYGIARDDEKQKQFQNILRAIGFEIKLKPFIKRQDGSAKGEWDVGITLDIIEYAHENIAIKNINNLQNSSLNKIILLSGDGDFDLLVQRIKEKFALEFEVYGVRNLTANSLINAADSFIEIKENLLL